MAQKTTTQKATDAARAVASNPYLRRLIEDEELRRNIRDAFDAVRGAGQRIYEEPSPARAIFDDRKIQDELRNAAETLRDASDQLQKLRSQALATWGTDDLDELKLKLVKMQEENEARRAKYQSDLQTIESKLKEIDEKYQGLRDSVRDKE
jgi:hypothetical protein